MCLIRRDGFPAKRRSVKDTDPTKASYKNNKIRNYYNNNNMNKINDIMNNKQDAHPQKVGPSSTNE